MNNGTRRRWVGASLLAFCLAFVGGGMAVAQRQPLPLDKEAVSTTWTVADLTTGQTAAGLAEMLVGSGVSVSDVQYQGVAEAGAVFVSAAGAVGFSTGIVLSTGAARSVVGPNLWETTSSENQAAGDADLTALAGHPTFDAVTLSFDFIPDAPWVYFRYVFASEEYNEYANTEFNDVFAFFVNGDNCATVEGGPVSVNSVNAGNPQPGEDPTPHHPELFRNNALSVGAPLDTEMDGVTVVLTCVAEVTPFAVNHLKLAIADATDDVGDSAVFIKAGSLTTAPTSVGLSDFAGISPSWPPFLLFSLFLLLMPPVGWLVRRRQRAGNSAASTSDQRNAAT
ncbi:MAG: choice-of-anchor L domain-containing protein [Ardenticatenales bacterium]|nr:choice-of-anchor L domain-containing protein [Ardenticatenales bacterium]